MKKKREKEIHYKNGGYYREIELKPGIYLLEMDGKGFHKRIVKNLIRKKLL